MRPTIPFGGFVLLFLGCGDDAGTCRHLAEEDAKCTVYQGTPAFHVCESEADAPPSGSCVPLGETGDYCCPSGFDDGASTAGPGLDPDIDPLGNTGYRPDLTASWQWQLQGTLDTSYAVDIYDVDLFETDEATIAALRADGRRVICYFSAGSAEDWRDDYDDFAASALGSALEGWEGERWLDITDETVLRVMLARLNVAKEKGCDGVEPDNVDGYANASGFRLTSSQQLGFNKRIANEAHARSLFVLLKNDLGQIAELVEYFDGALNEECFTYDECDAVTSFIEAGKPVFQAEYADDASGAEERAIKICADARARQFHTLILSWELDNSFRISCDDFE